MEGNKDAGSVMNELVGVWYGRSKFSDSTDGWLIVRLESVDAAGGGSGSV